MTTAAPTTVPPTTAPPAWSAGQGFWFQPGCCCGCECDYLTGGDVSCCFNLALSSPDGTTPAALFRGLLGNWCLSYAGPCVWEMPFYSPPPIACSDDLLIDGSSGCYAEGLTVARFAIVYEDGSYIARLTLGLTTGNIRPLAIFEQDFGASKPGTGEAFAFTLTGGSFSDGVWGTQAGGTTNLPPAAGWWPTIAARGRFWPDHVTPYPVAGTSCTWDVDELYCRGRVAPRRIAIDIRAGRSWPSSPAPSSAPPSTAAPEEDCRDVLPGVYIAEWSDEVFAGGSHKWIATERKTAACTLDGVTVDVDVTLKFYFRTSNFPPEADDYAAMIIDLEWTVDPDNAWGLEQTYTQTFAHPDPGFREHDWPGSVGNAFYGQLFTHNGIPDEFYAYDADTATIESGGFGAFPYELSIRPVRCASPIGPVADWVCTNTGGGSYDWTQQDDCTGDQSAPSPYTWLGHNCDGDNEGEITGTFCQ